MDFPPFPGFREEAFAFLRDLKANNRRDWFKPRKETYEDEVVWPLRCLLLDAAREAAGRGLPLRADPRRSIFRIYRDTRFSKNKDPYKTHAGGVLSRTGDHRSPGVVYVHVEPGASFLGAGFWRPDAALLRAWRHHMAAAPEAFLDLAADLEARGLPLDDDVEMLRRMPRGFEAHADTALAPYLRRKSFVVTRPVDEAALATPDFTATLVAFMEAVMPLLAFGWAAETHRPRDRR